MAACVQMNMLAKVDVREVPLLELNKTIVAKLLSHAVERSHLPEAY
jgi:hypothetical protein